MAYLLDTNVISELSRRQKGDRAVSEWLESVPSDSLWLSVLVVAEIRRGIESLRLRTPDRAEALESWLGLIEENFAGRILPVSLAIAHRWGRIQALRTVAGIDAFLAATAIEHGLILVTRNARDVEGIGVEVLNPFSA